jgi:hypothetical protein
MMHPLQHLRLTRTARGDVMPHTAVIHESPREAHVPYTVLAHRPAFTAGRSGVTHVRETAMVVRFC